MSDAAVLDDVSVSNKPVKSFKIRGISAAIFANHTKDGSQLFHKVVLERNYKVGEEYKTTSSFSRDDLPMVQAAAGQAFDWILSEEDRQKAAKN